MGSVKKVNHNFVSRSCTFLAKLKFMLKRCRRHIRSIFHGRPRTWMLRISPGSRRKGSMRDLQNRWMLGAFRKGNRYQLHYQNTTVMFVLPSHTPCNNGTKLFKVTLKPIAYRPSLSLIRNPSFHRMGSWEGSPPRGLKKGSSLWESDFDKIKPCQQKFLRKNIVLWHA